MSLLHVSSQFSRITSSSEFSFSSPSLVLLSPLSYLPFFFPLSCFFLHLTYLSSVSPWNVWRLCSAPATHNWCSSHIHLTRIVPRLSGGHGTSFLTGVHSKTIHVIGQRFPACSMIIPSILLTPWLFSRVVHWVIKTIIGYFLPFYQTRLSHWLGVRSCTFPSFGFCSVPFFAQFSSPTI